MFTVYILKSLKDQKRYIGSTNNLERRLRQHDHGLVASTKYRRPFKILRIENFMIEKDARLREKFLKSHRGYNELKKLIGE